MIIRKAMYGCGLYFFIKLAYNSPILCKFAIIAHEGELYIINESKIDIDLCYMTNVNNPIKVFLKGITI